MKLAQRSSTQEMDVLCERPDDGASAQTAHRRTGNIGIGFAVGTSVSGVAVAAAMHQIATAIIMDEWEL